MTSPLSLILLGLALTSVILINGLPSERGVDVDYYFDYIGSDGDIPFWKSEKDLDFKAVVCTECPRRLRPPSKCTKCTSDANCAANQVCCPFITLRSTLGGCTNEQSKTCKLSSTITIDFFRKVCSCVKQVKCCTRGVSTNGTTIATPTPSTYTTSTGTQPTTFTHTPSTATTYPATTTTTTPSTATTYPPTTTPSTATTYPPTTLSTATTYPTTTTPSTATTYPPTTPSTATTYPTTTTTTTTPPTTTAHLTTTTLPTTRHTYPTTTTPPTTASSTTASTTSTSTQYGVNVAAP